MSLLLRLTIPLGLLFLGVFSFVGLAAVRVTADTVERGLEARIDETLATISANPEFFVIEAALREAKERHLSQVADISGFEIVVVGPGGLLASTIDRSAAVALVGRGPQENRFEIALGGVEYRGARGKVTGRTVYLLSRAEPIEAAKAEAERQVILLAGLGFVISILIGLLLAGTLTRPIRRLARAVGEVREGGERPDLPDTGGREVRDLSRAFRSMLERLSRYREELVSREKMATLGQFSAAVAHELRNPLSSMRMTLDLVREEVGEEVREDLDRLRTEANRLDHSIEELLFYAGRPQYEMTRVDPSEVVAATVGMIEPLAAHLEVALETRATAGAFVHGDADRLRQALTNLVLNAVQASGPGDTVRIEVESRKDRVSLVVTDSGPGPAAEISERIFEPFVSGRSGGTGLGLAVTAAIAKAHEGEVEFAREAGRTRFRLVLPREGA
jgi:signal transduction histidine kinase